MQTLEVLVRNMLYLCLKNVNHAITCAMSVFITAVLTLAVCCCFLLSLHKDREAVQTPKMPFGKKMCYSHHV